MAVLFGYRQVSDPAVPRCPCGDNTLMAESDGGLHLRLRCWCGSKIEGSFRDEADRAEFLARHGA